MQRQLSKILTVGNENVESVEPYLVVVPAIVQPIEVRPAVDAERSRFLGSLATWFSPDARCKRVATTLPLGAFQARNPRKMQPN